MRRHRRDSSSTTLPLSNQEPPFRAMTLCSSALLVFGRHRSACETRRRRPPAKRHRRKAAVCGAHFVLDLTSATTLPSLAQYARCSTPERYITIRVKPATTPYVTCGRPSRSGHSVETPNRVGLLMDTPTPLRPICRDGSGVNRTL